MFNIEEGNYNFNYSKENIKCQFNISKDGYLSDIKKADTIFMGGSATAVTQRVIILLFVVF